MSVHMHSSASRLPLVPTLAVGLIGGIILGWGWLILRMLDALQQMLDGDREVGP